MHPSPTPTLATDIQLEAEAKLRAFMTDPEVLAFLAGQKARLADHPVAQTRDGAARLSHDVDAWAAGLVMRWISGDPGNPAFILSIDNTPHSWLGADVPALGAAGDNPDNIYRNTFIDGGGRYEITGRKNLENPSSQLSFDVMRGVPSRLTLSSAASGTKEVFQNDVITDREIVFEADGSFVIEVDGRDGAIPNHLRISDEPLVIIAREALSDWSQSPSHIAIRRLDKPPEPAMTYDELKARVLADLPDYLDFWTDLPARWMGGIAANGVAAPVPRDGGWGWQGGVRFDLAPGDVMVVTMKQGQADYMGTQVCDPFFIAPDGRKHTTSINNSQARPNADGTCTFVIAAEDPGAVNWLDTGGLHTGLGVLRWQAVPPGEPVKDYLIEARTMDRATFEREYSHLDRLTASQRAAQRAVHSMQYDLRYRR